MGRRVRVLAPLLVAGLLATSCAAAEQSASPGPGVTGTRVAEPAATGPTATDPPGTIPSGSRAPDSDVDEIGEDDALPDTGTPTLDVGRYDLDLSYEPNDGHLSGTATLDARAVVELGAGDHPTIDLDLQRFEIERVEVDGREATSSWGGAKLRIEPPEVIPADRRFTISVTYAGVPETVGTDALPGIRVGWQVGRAGSMVMAEPDGAKSWFPVNDHPLDKATFTIAMTVPEPFTAVASGRLTGTDEGPDGRTFRWAMDDPMAPYLATVVTGRLEESAVSEEDGVAYSSWSEAGGSDAALLDEMPELVARMAAKLGPFPFTTYGAVVYPPSFLPSGDGRSQDFLAAVALEAQGRSLYSEAALEPATVIHETAHQWFGDSVSITDWSDDIWWVEGFATFAETAFARGATGDGPLAAAPFRRSYDECRGQSVTPLPVDDLFGTAAYSCGALVFYALHEEVGTDAFWRIVRTFVDAHRHANATTEDLIAAAVSVGGAGLDAFLRSWLSVDRPALPS